MRSALGLWLLALLLYTTRWRGAADFEDGFEVGGGEEAAPEGESSKGLLLRHHVWCPEERLFELRNATAMGCFCEQGWAGADCALPVCEPECGQGSCVRPNKCSCKRGWRGKLCHQAICMKKCFMGDCIQPNLCKCQEHWYGDSCNVHCVNGQVDLLAPDGQGVKPINPCKCKHGWKGAACDKPACFKTGCANGKCVAPDRCSCDPGWVGKDCQVDMVSPNAKWLVEGIHVNARRFQGLVLSRASKSRVWESVKHWTGHLNEDMKVNKITLYEAVPFNDTVPGHNGNAEVKFDGNHRFGRCAVVGDGVGLLQTGLGAVVDKHDAVLRFNNAPTKGFEDHVGRRTTFRLLNRRAAFGHVKKMLAKPAAPARGKAGARGAAAGRPKVEHSQISGKLLLWRPETLHLYPHFRKKKEYQDVTILQPEVAMAAVDMYERMLERMVKTKIVVESNPQGKSEDRTVVRGHRVPTSWVGISLMMQMCEEVNVFGFDPPSIQDFVHSLGRPQETYYSDMGIQQAADERGEKDVVFSPLNVPDAERMAAATTERAYGGERYPGDAGTAGDGAFTYAFLRTLEINGDITLCTTKSPERCVAAAGGG